VTRANGLPHSASKARALVSGIGVQDDAQLAEPPLGKSYEKHCVPHALPQHEPVAVTCTSIRKKLGSASSCVAAISPMAVGSHLESEAWGDVVIRMAKYNVRATG